MLTKKTYDIMCYNLAEHFLLDFDRSTPDQMVELAQHIQDAIEDYVAENIHDLAEDPDARQPDPDDLRDEMLERQSDDRARHRGTPFVYDRNPETTMMSLDDIPDEGAEG